MLTSWRYRRKTRTAWRSAAGACAINVHQLPGVPPTVPGSATGSRSPNMKSYILSVNSSLTSARGTGFRRGIACPLGSVQIAFNLSPSRYVNAVRGSVISQIAYSLPAGPSADECAAPSSGAQAGERHGREGIADLGQRVAPAGDVPAVNP